MHAETPSTEISSGLHCWWTLGYLALGVMSAYHHQSSGRTVVVESYRDARDQIDAIYASGRLILPFDGLLLFGY